MGEAVVSGALAQMVGAMIVVGGIESLQSKSSFKVCMERSADTILHEFAASMLMLTLFSVVLAFFFPFGDAVVWPMHAVCVFIFDFLTPGACANPAFTVGLYVFGKISAYTAFAKFLGQLWASRIAFTLMGVIPFAKDMLARRYDGRAAACPALSSLVLCTLHPVLTSSPPIYPSCTRSAARAPVTTLPLLEACVAEGALTALFAGSAFLISNRVRSSYAQSGIVAAVLRMCCVLGGDHTGASMNPLWAQCWLLHFVQGDPFQSKQWDYVLIYLLSPVVGASLAAAAVTSVNAAFPVAEDAASAGSMMPVAAASAALKDKKAKATPAKAVGKAKGEAKAREGEEVEEEEAEAPAKPRTPQAKAKEAEAALVEGSAEQQEKKVVRRRRKQ